MKYTSIVFIASVLMLPLSTKKEQPKIYHKGWIDFNKNGIMDVYENPKATIDARVANLVSLMNVEEKPVKWLLFMGSLVF